MRLLWPFFALVVGLSSQPTSKLTDHSLLCFSFYKLNSLYHLKDYVEVCLPCHVRFENCWDVQGGKLAGLEDGEEAGLAARAVADDDQLVAAHPGRGGSVFLLSLVVLVRTLHAVKHFQGLKQNNLQSKISLNNNQ